jgi:hypothetical protein
MFRRCVARCAATAARIWWRVRGAGWVVAAVVSMGRRVGGIGAGPVRVAGFADRAGGGGGGLFSLAFHDLINALGHGQFWLNGRVS